MSDLTFSVLKLSDLVTGFTSALNDWVFSTNPSIKKAGFSIVLSIVSRIVSDNIYSPLGSVYTSQSSKNQIIVGLMSGLGSLLMKRRSVLRDMHLSVISDLQSEWILKSIASTMNSAGATDYQTFDLDLVGPFPKKA